MVVKCDKHKLYGYQNIVIFVLYVINRGCDEWCGSGVMVTPFPRSPNLFYREKNIYKNLELFQMMGNFTGGLAPRIPVRTFTIWK